MSVAVGFIIRLLGLFGISLSPFLAGAIVAGLIAGAFGFYSYKLYDAGYSSAEGECQAAALQSKIDALEMDRDNAQLAAKAAAMKLASIEKATEENKGRTDAYVAELEKRASAPQPDGSKASGCGLTPDDLRGMHADAKPNRIKSRSSGRARLFGSGGGAAAKIK